MKIAALAIVAGLMSAFARPPAPPQVDRRDVAIKRPTAHRSEFGKLPDGTPIEMATLRNRNGLEMTAITYGATIVSLRVPDRAGKFDDVVAGHESMDGYLNRSRFFGAVVGRYANRIANGRFVLDRQRYQLPVNNGPNSLHGGVRGFDKVVWSVSSTDLRATDASAFVTFSRTSPDGEEGYPGTLKVRVTYELTNRNELVITYTATTDKATPVNLTQHSYFNLGGFKGGDVLDDRLTIWAEAYTPVNETMIPTGEIAPVTGTPFDFRRATRIGTRIDADHPQLKLAGGYDHNFVLSGWMPPGSNGNSPLGEATEASPGAVSRRGPILGLAARLEDPASGRVMEVRTTEPGLQLNTANKLDNTYVGKRGEVYGRRSAVCLETQHYPDSPNQPAFPSTILAPGTTMRSITVYAFSVVR